MTLHDFELRRYVHTLIIIIVTEIMSDDNGKRWR